MAEKLKRLAVRITGAVVLLLLPLLMSPLGLILVHENEGDSLPLISILSFVAGLVVAAILAKRTVFFPVETALKKVLMRVVVVAGFEAALLGALFAITNDASIKPEEPNQALEPTPTAVTIRADARLAPAAGVAHL